MQALAAKPGTPGALKNLGAILGKEGDCLRALYYLRRSLEIDPQDPQTVYGLAFAYMELGDMESAQKHLALRYFQLLVRLCAYSVNSVSLCVLCELCVSVRTL